MHRLIYFPELYAGIITDTNGVVIHKPLSSCISPDANTVQSSTRNELPRSSYTLRHGMVYRYIPCHTSNTQACRLFLYDNAVSVLNSIVASVTGIASKRINYDFIPFLAISLFVTIKTDCVITRIIRNPINIV